MNTMKVVGFVAAGIGLAAFVGGGIWLWRRHKNKKRGESPDQPRVRPSGPPRRVPEDEDAAPEDTKPRGHMTDKDELHAELQAEIDRLFPGLSPPPEEVVNNLTQEEVVVFGVESEPVGNYTETRQELITAKVLSVETSVVRARIIGPVAHAEHHGSHAGHGFRVGDLVEIPRSKVLIAARPGDLDKTGYNSKGKAARTFKPSDVTKEIYKVSPGTPYDLVLPYRSKEIAWYVDRELVKLVKIGEKGLLEQIMFSEDSMRGEVSVRALDEDPEYGKVFVARWDFQLDA